MAIFRGRIRQTIRILTCASAMLLVVLGTAYGAGYTVIAHSGVPDSTLSKGDLQAIFLGEKVKWSNRKQIAVAVQDDPGALREFLQQIVGKTPSQFDNHWQKMVFTGRAILPKYFEASDQVVEYVAGRPGAIGLVVSGTPTNNVKTISIK